MRPKTSAAHALIRSARGRNGRFHAASTSQNHSRLASLDSVHEPSAPLGNACQLRLSQLLYLASRVYPGGTQGSLATQFLARLGYDRLRNQSLPAILYGLATSSCLSFQPPFVPLLFYPLTCRVATVCRLKNPANTLRRPASNVVMREGGFQKPQ